MSDASGSPPPTTDDAARPATSTPNAAAPYLTVLGLAFMIGLILLAYLWSEREEIVRVLTVSPI